MIKILEIVFIFVHYSYIIAFLKISWQDELYNSAGIFRLKGWEGIIVATNKGTDKLYYVYRILALFLFMLLFLPAVNPARICRQ